MGSPKRGGRRASVASTIASWVGFGNVAAVRTAPFWDMRLKELEDNRKTLSSNITNMTGKIMEFCAYTNYRTQKEQERIQAEREEAKRLAAEAKAMAGKRGALAANRDANSPLKSALSRK